MELSNEFILYASLNAIAMFPRSINRFSEDAIKMLILSSIYVGLKTLPSILITNIHEKLCELLTMV